MTLRATKASRSLDQAEQARQSYPSVRSFSEELCQTLSPEDCVIQSMPDASPTRWHLAHTTWFFERFVLSERVADYRPLDPAYNYLFNSYYNTVGEQYPRPQRGLLSRPTVREIWDYRHHVDRALATLLSGDVDADTLAVIEIGLHHEQQHQELMLTDLKHAFSLHPLFPVFREPLSPGPVKSPAGVCSWRGFDGGMVWVGHDGDGFAYDNESTRHRVFLEPFELASRLVTAEEYLAFMDDGGYRRPELWLSAGWQEVCESGWSAPLYWLEKDAAWYQFTLAGLRPVEPREPVCHVSYYEADAFARWSGARLATESEWETAARDVPIGGNFAENSAFHTVPLDTERGGGEGAGVCQMFGDVWEWTSSPYVAYPGYRAMDGALGEYNGKFMCNQFVLRGGSCATSRSHIRGTYRNFFPPEARWQFSGIRLAR